MCRRTRTFYYHNDLIFDFGPLATQPKHAGPLRDIFFINCSKGLLQLLPTHFPSNVQRLQELGSELSIQADV